MDIGVGAQPPKPAVEAEAQKELPPWLRGEKALANSDGTGPSTTGTGTGVGSGLPGSMSIGTGRSEDISDTAAAQSEAEVLVCPLPHLHPPSYASHLFRDLALVSCGESVNNNNRGVAVELRSICSDYR